MSAHPGSICRIFDSLSGVKPWYTQNTHAKAGKEDEKERYSDDPEFVGVAASFSLALGSSNDNPADRASCS